MSRVVLILNSAQKVAEAMRLIRMAPEGSRVEIKGAKRTLPQNDRMWAMLGDIARQKDHFGRMHSPNVWKCIFLKALARENELVLSLDGTELIEIGESSADLSKSEMADMITMMLAWGDQNGVQFHDPESLRLAEMMERSA